MSRRVQIVVLCEDKQHESFLRRFLRKRGIAELVLRVERSAGGAADRWVRDRHPKELEAVRKGSVARALAVMIDGDQVGVAARIGQLGVACDAQGVERRSQTDRAAIFVPTWNVETWLAYLRGEIVEEGRSNYPRLDRERECHEQVDALAAMCDRGTLREPAPASLRAACEEYGRITATLR